MKNNIFQAVFILVLLLVQTAALAVLPEASIWFPQLILLYVIAFALNHTFVETAWLSFGMGLLSEVFSTSYLGSSALAFFLTGILIYFVTRKLTSQDVSLATLIFLAVPATLLFPLWAFLFSGFLSLLGISARAAFGDFYSTGVLWLAFSNLVFLYPLNFLVTIINKR